LFLSGVAGLALSAAERPAFGQSPSNDQTQQMFAQLKAEIAQIREELAVTKRKLAASEQKVGNRGARAVPAKSPTPSASVALPAKTDQAAFRKH
jgi:hypothetical protein